MAIRISAVEISKTKANKKRNDEAIQKYAQWRSIAYCARRKSHKNGMKNEKKAKKEKDRKKTN